MGGEENSSSASEPGGEEKALLHIRCTNGSKFSVHVGLSSTVGSLKAILVDDSHVPADQQRLIYKGRVLKDDNTLQSYGLQSDHTVHLVRGAPSSSAGAAAGTGTADAPQGNNFEGFGGVAGVGNLNVPDFGGNGGGIAGMGIPEFQQVQQQLMQNPNLMREMMNMPAVQSLMNNPDLMRNVIMSNPQMREIIDRNPDLAHILNDPSTLRQTLDAARNPELMREMMRNTDRAMSNIESSPEGFNMLRRMYETVQEPLLNAATMGTDSGTDLSSNPFAALFGSPAQAQNQTSGTNGVSTTSRTSVAPGQAQNQTFVTNGVSTASSRTSSVAPNTAPLPNPWNPENAAGAGGVAATGQATAGRASTNSGILGGHAGFSPPDFGSLGGGLGLVDPAAIQQMLQNPAVLHMMQGLFSNPQHINQMINMQPHLRALLNSNPQFREMLQNPDFLQQLMSPEALQQMLTLQQALMGHASRQQPGQTPAANGSPGNNSFDLNSLLNLFGALGAVPSATPEVNTVPPEELYATQLTQLQDMGFVDTQANIRALTATGGNVHAAVERLLNG